MAIVSTLEKGWPGKTVASWLSYRDVVSVAEAELRDLKHKDLSPTRLRRLATLACQDFAVRSETAFSELFYTLIPDQAEYRLPADLLKIRGVRTQYPGWTGERKMIHTQRDKILGLDATIPGVPSHWWEDYPRAVFGLTRVPSLGGVEGSTTSSGNVGGTTLVSSNLSSVDDFYNGMEVLIQDGVAHGEQQTISDYDGTTGTITVDTAFSAQIVSPLEFTIHPNSLKLDYVARGNPWRVNALKITITAATDGSRFLATVVDRKEIDYFKGMEMYALSEGASSVANKEEKVRILHSWPSGSVSETDFTVFPPLSATPSVNDTLQINDVPNIPQDFHYALVEWVVSQVLRSREKTTQAREYFTSYMGYLRDARMLNIPSQKETYRRIPRSRAERFGRRY